MKKRDRDKLFWKLIWVFAQTLDKDLFVIQLLTLVKYHKIRLKMKIGLELSRVGAIYCLLE